NPRDSHVRLRFLDNIHGGMKSMKYKNIKSVVAATILTVCMVTSMTASAQSEFLNKFKEMREKFQTSKPDDQKKSLKKVEDELKKTQDPADKKLLYMAK